MEKLYDYLFHYNPFQKLWYAFKREDYNKYFNGDKKELMKHADIEELVTMILTKEYKIKDE
jgi:hypothetical protein